MKLKLDDAGHAVLQDNKPVYVKEDGTETAFDVVGTVSTISRLNGEAKSHREAKEAAETALKAFDGLDAAKAREAIETVQNLDQKKLVDAGELDKVKAEIAKSFEPIKSENDALKQTLNQERLANQFAQSSFVGEKLAIPSDFVQERFGKQFQFKEGKLIPHDANGNPIYDPGNPGEYAPFDKALEIMVEAHPQKDHILKGTGNNGGGTQSSSGGDGGTQKQVTRTQFDGMSQMERTTFSKEGGKVIEG